LWKGSLAREIFFLQPLLWGFFFPWFVLQFKVPEVEVGIVEGNVDEGHGYEKNEA